jgi:hypothetical protein
VQLHYSAPCRKLRLKVHLKLCCVLCVQDDDLRALRERREWLEAVADMRGSMSKGTKANMRSEARVGSW